MRQYSEKIEASVADFIERVQNSLCAAFELRQGQSGISKFQLAKKTGRSQAMIERMMSGEGLVGLRPIGAISHTLGVRVSLKLEKLERPGLK
jgi:transcriptional regulator with XRE-family HTH domain